jgi:hypothetical protein
MAAARYAGERANSTVRPENFPYALVFSARF